MERSQPGGATGSQKGAGSQVRIKQENDDSNATHSHTVIVKTSASDKKEFTRTCEQPRTVLELLKLSGKYDRTWTSDENIVIQMGRADKECIIATHFPCTCINDNELLTLFCKSKKVEEARSQNEQPILSRDRYSVFYIEKEGGINTTTKKLFKNNAAIKKCVVVYGEKGMTVKEAVERDGRFIDDLGDFTLSHNENPDCHTDCTEPVDILDKKEFKLCLQRKTTKEIPGPTLAVLRQKGISVRTAKTKTGGTVDLEKIYEELREQFPDLKELMKSRFPGVSYQEALDLKTEDFGKIQQSFSEVHILRDILKLGKSVCKVIVKDYFQGTGFVLFDNYILTNAHLFKGCTEGQTLKQGVQVYVLFNYEKPEPFTNYKVFEVAHSYIHYIEDDLDYAVLMLNTVGEKFSQSKERMDIKVPPGLLNKFGPKPSNGGACIIGHPEGHLKEMDLTCIIENRGHKDTLFTIQPIHHLIKKDAVDQIMTSGNRAGEVATYNTFMYHGSSGSPVFDANGKVFGLHTAGFVTEIPKKTNVIEFAQSLLNIFEHFVKVLKERKLLDLLRRVEEEATWNSYLREVLSRLE